MRIASWFQTPAAKRQMITAPLAPPTRSAWGAPTARTSPSMAIAAPKAFGSPTGVGSVASTSHWSFNQR